MLNKEKAHDILSEAIRSSQADETEIILSGGKTFLSRFTNNYLSQNATQKDYTLTVRVAFGNKIGVASCNIFDGDNLRKVVDNACLAARHSQADHEWVPVLPPQTYAVHEKSYFPATVDFSADERAQLLEPILKGCIEQNLTAAGMFTNGDSMLAIMNSKELFAYHAQTHVDFTFTAMADQGGSSWAECHATDMNEINLTPLTQKAMVRALLARNPGEIEPGAYTVILEPPAVLELVEFLALLGLGGQSFHEDRSFAKGRLNEKVFSSSLTLRDDPMCWPVLGAPFDFEGYPKKSQTLIEQGVIRQVVHDRRTAKLTGQTNTGHALMPPNSYGPLPINLVLDPGTHTIEDMIAQTEKGIYVTRFWYSNVVEEKKATTTGMSRDGTFLIENGRLTKPLRNMRYNQSLLDAFANLESIGDTLHTFSSYFGKMAVPALKISNFHFTGISRE